MTDMLDRETIKAEIREAFASLEYPGDWCLRGSNEGQDRNPVLQPLPN